MTDHTSCTLRQLLAFQRQHETSTVFLHDGQKKIQTVFQGDTSQNKSAVLATDSGMEATKCSAVRDIVLFK